MGSSSESWQLRPSPAPTPFNAYADLEADRGSPSPAPTGSTGISTSQLQNIINSLFNPVSGTAVPAAAHQSECAPAAAPSALLGSQPPVNYRYSSTGTSLIAEAFPVLHPDQLQISDQREPTAVVVGSAWDCEGPGMPVGTPDMSLLQWPTPPLPTEPNSCTTPRIVPSPGRRFPSADPSTGTRPTGVVPSVPHPHDLSPCLTTPPPLGRSLQPDGELENESRMLSSYDVPVFSPTFTIASHSELPELQADIGPSYLTCLYRLAEDTTDCGQPNVEPSRECLLLFTLN